MPVQPIQPVWLGPRPQGIPKARGGRPEFERRVIVSESSSSSSRRASVSDSTASASSSQVQHQDPQSVTTASSSSNVRPVQQQCLVSQDLPGVRVWKVDSEYNPVEVWLEEVSRQLFAPGPHGLRILAFWKLTGICWH